MQVSIRWIAVLIVVLLVAVPWMLMVPSVWADLREGLVAYWSFDEGAGATAHDYSGNGNDGAVLGATWVEGISGYAVHFDGVDDRVECGTDEVFRIPMPVTIAAWIRKEPGGGYQGQGHDGIVSTDRVAGRYSGYALQLGEKEGDWYRVATGYGDCGPADSGSRRSKKSAGVVTRDTWYHIAAILRGPQDMTIYVNGQDVGGSYTGEGGPVCWLGGPCVVGCTWAYDYFFKGAIDEVRIYSRVLREEDIAHLYGSFAVQRADNNYGIPGLSGSSEDPVNTAVGDFGRREVDFSIAGRGRALTFSRFYNSQDSTGGPLGTGWTHSYNIRLSEPAPDSQVPVRWDDGRVDYWWEKGSPGLHARSVPGSYDRLVRNEDNSWTLTKADGEEYEFDSAGRLLWIRDKNGNTTAMAYDNASFPNLVTRVADPAGRTLNLSYDSSGLLQRVSDFCSPPRVVRYSYQDGRFARAVDALGDTVEYDYDDEGRLDTVVDQRGVTAVINTYHPDGSGRVVDQRDGNGQATIFDYGVEGENDTRITRQVTVPGKRRSHPLVVYHPHEEAYKRQLAIEDALADSVSFDYDLWYNRIAVIDRNGHATRFGYDDIGNVVSTTEADDPGDPHDGGVTAVVYGDSAYSHFPMNKTDALGRETEWTYDDHGNVVTEKRWLDTGHTQSVVKSWTYNDFGQRLTETDERENVHRWFYDANGLLTHEVSALGDTTWYGYDSLWRRIWVTDARGGGPEDPAHTTRYTYDNADRIIRIEGPPVGSPPHAIVQSFGYDEIGNRTMMLDGRGDTTRYVYDGNSNLIQVTEPLGRVTRHEYDELNRRVRTIDANNDTTTFVYDDSDRLIGARDGEGNLWTYGYDAQGNLMSETDPSGVTLTHAYDALNRRVRTTDELGHFWETEYDQVDNVTKLRDPTGGITQYAYDALNRLVSVRDAEGGTIQYRYDRSGNLTGILNAKGEWVSSREYDALNRLVRVTDADGNSTEYGYDEVGNQVRVRDAMGRVDTLIYDGLNRLIGISSLGVSYSYDNSANLIEMVDSTGTSEFTFDALNRLRSSTDGRGLTVEYEYDSLGSRTALVYPDGKRVTYAYDHACPASVET